MSALVGADSLAIGAGRDMRRCGSRGAPRHLSLARCRDRCEGDVPHSGEQKGERVLMSAPFAHAAAPPSPCEDVANIFWAFERLDALDSELVDALCRCAAQQLWKLTDTGLASVLSTLARPPMPRNRPREHIAKLWRLRRMGCSRHCP